MNTRFVVGLFVFLSLFLMVSVSASLCRGYDGYYRDCGGYSYYDSYDERVSYPYFRNGPYYYTPDENRYYAHTYRYPRQVVYYADGDRNRYRYHDNDCYDNMYSARAPRARYVTSTVPTSRTEYTSDSSLYERTTDYDYGPYGLEGSKTTVVRKSDHLHTRPAYYSNTPYYNALYDSSPSYSWWY